MKTVKVKIRDLVQTYPTVDGGTLNVIKTIGNQCPNCFRVLSSIRNKDNPKLIDYQICDCGDDDKVISYDFE